MGRVRTLVVVMTLVAACSSSSTPATALPGGVSRCPNVWTCEVPSAPTCADGTHARYFKPTTPAEPPVSVCDAEQLTTCATLQGGVCDLCCP